MSGPSSSKGKDRAVEQRLDDTNEQCEQTTAANETNDEVDDNTMDQMQERQRVLTALINKAPDAGNQLISRFIFLILESCAVPVCLILSVGLSVLVQRQL
jgi:hypothetical protein